jgi:hypothetical protein
MKTLTATLALLGLAACSGPGLPACANWPDDCGNGSIAATGPSPVTVHERINDAISPDIWKYQAPPLTPVEVNDAVRDAIGDDPEQPVEPERPEERETVAALGNPGNGKPVGNAGENPNGKDGWGTGEKGRNK